MGSDPAKTLVGEKKVVIKRARGGGSKATLLKIKAANVTDPATGKSQKTDIVRVVKNPANIDYERRGVITKGAIIETSIGNARVSSRPGQDGVVNAVLLEKTRE